MSLFSPAHRTNLSTTAFPFFISLKVHHLCKLLRTSLALLPRRPSNYLFWQIEPAQPSTFLIQRAFTMVPRKGYACMSPATAGHFRLLLNAGSRVEVTPSQRPLYHLLALDAVGSTLCRSGVGSCYVSRMSAQTTCTRQHPIALLTSWSEVPTRCSESGRDMLRSRTPGAVLRGPFVPIANCSPERRTVQLPCWQWAQSTLVTESVAQTLGLQTSRLNPHLWRRS